MTLTEELAALLNKYSAENSSDTPDFILANFLVGCLASYNIAVNNREQWYGREKGMLENLPSAVKRSG